MGNTKRTTVVYHAPTSGFSAKKAVSVSSRRCKASFMLKFLLSEIEFFNLYIIAQLVKEQMNRR